MSAFDFESLKECVPAEIIRENIDNLDNEQLKTLTAYFINNSLPGATLYMPLKAHHKYLAFLLLDLRVSKNKIEEVFKNEIGLDKRTIRKIFKEYEHDGRQ